MKMSNLVGRVLLCLGGLHATAQALDAHTWHPCPGLSLSADNTTATAAPWELSLSPYTHHWRYSVDHKPVFLAALDQRLNDNRFCGLALFRNSFGQPSTYVYAGKRWEGVLEMPQLFTKVSAGLIYGYKGKYQHKIPFNDYGVAPAIIPSVGWQIDRESSAQVMVLGSAGLLFAYGKRF